MACIFALCCPKDPAISPEPDDNDRQEALLNPKNPNIDYQSSSKINTAALVTMKAARSTPPSPAVDQQSLVKKQTLIIAAHKTLTLSQQQLLIQRLEASSSTITGLSESSEFSDMQSSGYSSTLQQLKVLTDHCKVAWSIIERATNDPTRTRPNQSPLSKKERFTCFCSKIEREDGSPTQRKDESLVAAYLSLTSHEQKQALDDLSARIESATRKLKSFETTPSLESSDKVSVGCTSKHSSTTATAAHSATKAKSVSPWTLNNMCTKVNELARCQTLLVKLPGTTLPAQNVWEIIDESNATGSRASQRVDRLLHYILSSPIEHVE
jgi:hypothetical protein